MCMIPNSSFVWDLIYLLLFNCMFDVNFCVNVCCAVRTWILTFKFRRRTFEEQLGMRLPSFVTPDFIARETTLLLALKASISSSSDKAGVIAALVSYAQAHSQRSLLGHLKSFMRPESDRDWNELICGHVNLMIEQNGESEEKWVSDLKEALSDWKRYKENKDIKGVLNILNYVVSVGMCEASSLTFRIEGLLFLSLSFIRTKLIVSIY